jgi:hypothetical protein
VTVKNPKANAGTGPRQVGQSIHSLKRIESVERQRRALEMRKEGCTYLAISKELGCSPQYAQLAVEAALKRVLQEPADAVRKLECERLDAMLCGTWARAATGNLGALDAVLKIMARRAKLLGLDVPTISGIFGGVASVNSDGSPMTPEQVAANIRQLAGALIPQEQPDS